MPNLLVTGKWGEPHVTSAQQRNYNAGIAGDGQYVMSGMTATMTNSNTCHIDPGVASFNGADVEVPAGGVDLTIENGTQGQKRNDLVVLRYTKNAGSQVEDVSLVVIKGTPSSGTATDPAHNEGSILDGDSPCDMPLWRIPLNGIDVGDPVQLFKDFESISDLRETISQRTIHYDGIAINQPFGQVWYRWIDITISISPSIALASIGTASGVLWIGAVNVVGTKLSIMVCSATEQAAASFDLAYLMVS